MFQNIINEGEGGGSGLNKKGVHYSRTLNKKLNNQVLISIVLYVLVHF